MALPNAPRDILVPIDFSAGAEHALDYACTLATKLDATVHLVHALGAGLPELSVALTDQMIETMRAASMAELEKLAEARAPVRFGKVIVQNGEARDAILETAADLHPDLIVIGSHGRRGLSRLVLGSVAEAVVRRAACPVLVVRAPKAE
jgi:universal stress protein A